MVCLTVAVAFWCLVKTWNLLKSIQWAAARGKEFDKRLRKKKPSDLDQKISIIETTGGNFLPFGVKSYRIRRILLTPWGSSYPTELLRRLVSLAANVPLNSGIYMIFCAGLIELANAANIRGSREDQAVLVLSIWLILYAVGLVIEAIVWYSSIKRYAGPYFFLNSKKRSQVSSSDKGREISVFVVLTSLIVLSLSIAVSTVQLRYGGFGHLPDKSGFLDEIRRFVQSTYFVLANMSTVGDDNMVPTRTISRLVVGLIFASTLFLVTFVFSLFSSIVQPDQDTKR